MLVAVKVHLLAMALMVAITHWQFGLNWAYHSLALICSGVALHHAHRMGHGHSRWFQKDAWMWWFRCHTIGHHGICYPHRFFLRPAYKVNPHGRGGAADAVAYGGHVLASLTVIKLALGWTWTWSQVVIILVEHAALLVAENQVHIHIHKDGSYLDQFMWFQQLRACHHAHHSPPYQCNYAVCALWIDMLVGTYCPPSVPRFKHL